MYVLSFIPNDRVIAIDADISFLSGFILKQFSAGNKAIKEEMRKTANRADEHFFTGQSGLCRLLEFVGLLRGLTSSYPPASSWPEPRALLRN